MFHTVAWLIWLVCAGALALVVSHPLYALLILGASGVVYLALGRHAPTGRSWAVFVRIGLALALVAVPFNMAFVHAGDVVLFALPRDWPLVGGPITLEAFLGGLTRALQLLTILVVFAAFNAAADHYQLLRATPAFLFEAGIMVTIAITFVPQMTIAARDIRQAQRIRGHRFRGWRDLLPLLMPLLTTSLERAIQLAEAMESRGFARAARPLTPARRVLVQTLTLAGLLGLLLGLFVMAYWPTWAALGWGVVGLGALVLAGVFWLQGRRVQRTRYRRPRWRPRDTALVVASLVPALAILAVKSLDPWALVYSPYPPFSPWPTFNLAVGWPLILLAAPALLAPRPDKRKK